MSREILALRRRDDGIFEFYEDGELAEEWIYDSPDEAWGMLLVKTLRHLKNIGDRRLKMINATKRCKHEWEWKEGYQNEIICRKCEQIRFIAELTRQQFLKLPLELRRRLLSMQAEGMIQEYLPCGLFGENLGQLSRE